MESLGRIKGAAFREFVRWFAASVDLERPLERIPRLEHPEAGELDPRLDGCGILVSRWYSAELVHELVDALMDGYDDAEQAEMAQQAANAIMGQTLRGVYKFIITTFVSPERYARHVDKLWSLHYDSGTPVNKWISDRSISVTFRDWRSHHPFICRMNMAAAYPIYTTMGCRGVTWRREGCISRGDQQCRSLITWEAAAD